MGDTALVRLELPVEQPGADRLKLGQDGPDDAQIDVVAHVNPDHDEEAKAKMMLGLKASVVLDKPRMTKEEMPAFILRIQQTRQANLRLRLSYLRTPTANYACTR